ncbi:MAG: DUF929 family protein [Solirubrobacterales bacterium]|nr:DUF929 family protein [Solirubrobacterales bacterium]
MRRIRPAVLTAWCIALLAPAAAAGAATAGRPLHVLVQAGRDLGSLAAGTRSPADRTSLTAAELAMGRATAPSLWIDPDHLVAPAHGSSAFANSRGALRDLEQVSPAAAPAGRIAGLEASILGADRDLAVGAIHQAAGGPGGLLARAGGMILSGDRWAATSRLDLGAEQYGAAWRSAFQALTDLVVLRTMSTPAAAVGAGAENGLRARATRPVGVRLVSGRAPLERAGRPEVLFVGLESCGLCAVERWGLVVALSRFGGFTNLRLGESATTSPPVLTSFMFVGSSYVSPYVSFVPLELTGDVRRPGGGYRPLARLTVPQRSLLYALDPAGVAPFVDVGNRAIDVGATVSSGALGGSSWPALAGSIRNPRAPSGQAIAAAAEVITAEICRATGGAPTSVCGGAAVRDYLRRLAGFGGRDGGCRIGLSERRRATASRTRTR